MKSSRIGTSYASRQDFLARCNDLRMRGLDERLVIDLKLGRDMALLERAEALTPAQIRELNEVAA